MYAEERFLERKFGEEYIIWASSLKSFLPNLKLFKPSIIPFLYKNSVKKRVFGSFSNSNWFCFCRGYTSLF